MAIYRRLAIHSRSSPAPTVSAAVCSPTVTSCPPSPWGSGGRSRTPAAASPLTVCSRCRRPDGRHDHGAGPGILERRPHLERLRRRGRQRDRRLRIATSSISTPRGLQHRHQCGSLHHVHRVGTRHGDDPLLQGLRCGQRRQCLLPGATASAATLLDDTIPTDGGLTATAGYTSIRLVRSDATDPQSGVVEYRLMGSDTPVADCTGTALATLPTWQYQYTDSGLAYGTTRHYRLCAVDGVGKVSPGLPTRPRRRPRCSRRCLRVSPAAPLPRSGGSTPRADTYHWDFAGRDNAAGGASGSQRRVRHPRSGEDSKLVLPLLNIAVSPIPSSRFRTDYGAQPAATPLQQSRSVRGSGCPGQASGGTVTHTRTPRWSISRHRRPGSRRC